MITAKKFVSQVMCKVCQHPTWHTVLNSVKKNQCDDELGLWAWSTFYTLQCQGCDNVCLVEHYQFSEDLDDYGNPVLQEMIYPSPYKDDRMPIDSNHIIQKDIRNIYLETIKAFNLKLMILAAIGIRATIEAIAIERSIKVRGIEAKIRKMQKLGIITNDGADLLLLVKDVGNLAAHEVKQHHHDDIALCIDIVEGILRSLYIYPEMAEKTKEVMKGKRVRA